MDYNKAIVITETSTGIGKACALYLANKYSEEFKEYTRRTKKFIPGIY